MQQQGGTTDSSQWRTRTFVYDSLSRLISATNPESGTTNYSYDADGNLMSKTDARGITVSYSYDALNRLIQKTYSDGEPATNYTYDQGTNGVGRRTGMTDAAGSEAWTYDSMGRVATDQRTTNGVTKTMSYTYSLDGTLQSLTYPSGRVVSYQVGGADLPISAADSTTTYASNASYAPDGALAGVALGQSVTLIQSYSSRLQPSTIHAASEGGTDLLDLAYDFGLGTADNGDVKAIVNNRDNTRTQYFSYDALNRIALANTQAATGANAWGQAFGYDPWGNLTSATVTQGSAPSLSVSVNAKNQIAGVPFTYDAAGNLLTDALNTYTWNAEGKMATVSNGQGSVTYTYDGDGKRVEKSSGKLYWYGTDGNVLAEGDAAGNLTDEYIFFGGNRIARVDSQNNVDYYLSDALGSSRLVTDWSGNISDDCDFMPFGNERCVASSSENSYKFTDKERDTESGNDYFSARYYSSQYSRFASPDPDNAGADSSNPQSWNGYAYALNSPTANTDPDGLDCLYLSSSSATSITVETERGSCTGEGGVYVNGTVDTSSFSYNGNSLGFNYTPYSGINLGTGTINFTAGLGSEDYLGAVAQGTQLASPWVNAAGAALGIFGTFVAPETLIPEAPSASLGLGGTAVIGKMADITPRSMGPVERTLDLPDMEQPRANWVQNSRKLRMEMREGRPIKDATALKYGKERFNTGFLRMERNLLENHGWTYSNGYWFPPKG